MTSDLFGKATDFSPEVLRLFDEYVHLATRLPDLGAAVSFYGSAPALDKVSRIRAPLQLHFAEFDERINAAWPAYRDAIATADVEHEAFTYPGTQHGFHNDTTPRYNPVAARQAWRRTIGLFTETLQP